MFRVKAITPPRGTLDPKKYKKAVETARGIAETVGLQEARGITRGWKHSVDWKIKRRGWTSDIVTSDKPFKYQDQGTRGPYVIRPRRKRALFWPGAAHPVRRVIHPGLKAQHFSDRIAEKMKKHYQRIVDDELSKVIP